MPSFDRDQIIFREGDASSFFYLILSGKVALEVTALGRTVRVQTVSDGEALGWSSVLPSEGKHFQARALGAVRALVFDGARLRELCEEDCSLGLRPDAAPARRCGRPAAGDPHSVARHVFTLRDQRVMRRICRGRPAEQLQDLADPMLPRPARVLQVDKETHDTFTLSLEGGNGNGQPVVSRRDSSACCTCSASGNCPSRSAAIPRSRAGWSTRCGRWARPRTRW